MIVRESTTLDLPALLDVERQAFGKDEGPVIIKLVQELINDPTAKPLLSLVAVEKNRLTGHVLFTNAILDDCEDMPVSLLAPVAVLPQVQKSGIGGKLISKGLQLLSDREVKLVFVLGHPEYYPRFGFRPAGALGFEPPYPIPEEVAGAWMVRELSPGVIGKVEGKVLCADSLDRPEYWRE